MTMQGFSSEDYIRHRKQEQLKWEADYESAIGGPYAIVQLSPRKWALMKDQYYKAIYDDHRFKNAQRFTILSYHANPGYAQEEANRLMMADVIDKILTQGKAYLITLTDDQLGKMPLGPICKAGLQDYMKARLKGMMPNGENPQLTQNK